MKTEATFKVLKCRRKKNQLWKRGWINLPIALKFHFFRRNNILQGILFGPDALLELREDMMLTISSWSVGCRNNVLILSLERSEKCLCEYFMLLFVVSAIEAK